jgi:hypothetical protein
MSAFRFTPLRLACGAILAAALFGCDGPTTVENPESGQESRLGTTVSLAEKEAAARATAPRGGFVPASAFYSVEQIPFEAGPTDVTTIVANCDDCVEDVSLGFDFQFYGNTYSTVQVSSNGFLRFDPANTNSGCCSGRPIPLDDLWNNIIAFAWTDLNPSGGVNGNLKYATQGTAPNRTFVVFADDVRYFGGTETNLRQWVMLHEGSNEIEIHTAVMTPRVITQGIENADGTDAAFVEGRVAATFSLNNDGVRFTPMDVNSVEIDNVYSGLPARDPGEIYLVDDYVFVEILDVEQYLPRPASPGDVRIGSSYANGTPAEDFQILDINNDGNRDIRLWWSIDELENDGNLTAFTTSLTVWGMDPTTGDLYRGDAEVEVFPPEPGDVLWNNGGIITHPGGGTGPIAGANVSMSDPIFNTAGSNVRHFPPDPHFRVADDFDVPAGGWTVGSVVTHAYQTGGVPAWTSANMNIRSGGPQGTIVASATTTNWQFTGIYRTFNGVLNDANRPVYALSFDFGTLNLDAGNYWIDWQVEGGASGWAPFVTEPDPTGGSNTSTVFGNGQQLTPLGWEPLLEAPGAETPFLVLEPGADHAPGGARIPVVRPGFQAPDGYASRTADSLR